MGSLGERNNNPGNLEASAWTRSQPGYVGTDGRFARFDTMASGIAAQVKLLSTRYLDKGFDTVQKIINRYGNDPGTQDDLSVSNYAKYVAGRLGINIGDKINPNQLGALAGAMREFETGNTVKGVSSSAASGEPGIVEKTISAIVPDGIENIFNGKTAARFASVAIGIILIGLAVAAFTLKSDTIQGVMKNA